MEEPADAAGHGRPQGASRGRRRPHARSTSKGSAARIFPLPVAAGQLLLPARRQGPGDLVLGTGIRRGRVRGDLQAQGRRPSGRCTSSMKEEEETVALEDKIGDYAPLGQRRAGHRRGRRRTISSRPWTRPARRRSSARSVNLDGMAYRVDTLAEWNQIFNDAWRWYRDFFYDADMHGQDWQAVGDRYRACIPQLSSRAELNWLMSQMVGELCVGHAYIGGGDMGAVKPADSPVFTGRWAPTWSPTRRPASSASKRSTAPANTTCDLEAPLARPDIAREGGRLPDRHQRPTVADDEDYSRCLQVTQGAEGDAHRERAAQRPQGAAHLRGRAAAQRPRRCATTAG